MKEQIIIEKLEGRMGKVDDFSKLGDTLERIRSAEIDVSNLENKKICVELTIPEILVTMMKMIATLFEGRTFEHYLKERILSGLIIDIDSYLGKTKDTLIEIDRKSVV